MFVLYFTALAMSFVVIFREYMFTFIHAHPRARAPHHNLTPLSPIPVQYHSAYFSFFVFRISGFLLEKPAFDYHWYIYLTHSPYDGIRL